MAISPDGKTMVTLGSGVATPGTRLAIKQGTNVWQDTAFDIGPLAPPAGYLANLNNSGGAGLIVIGAKGTLVVGSQIFRDSTHERATVVSTVWFSTDNTTWQRTDLRNVVGINNSFSITGATATTAGFVVVGTLTNVGTTRTTTLLTLTSADGLTWKKAGTVADTWALGPGNLTVWGSRLLLSGVEYVCDATGYSQVTAHLSAQARLWSSADNGATWLPVDMGAAGVTPTKPFPATVAQCPAPADPAYIQTLDAKFITDAIFLGVAGDKVILEGSAGAKAATSTDLTHWTVADLPDAVPADAGNTTVIRVPVRTLISDGQNPLILSFEPARNAQNQLASAGSQVLAWRSTDNGISWTKVGPAARPIIMGAYGADWVSFYQLADGSVLLDDQVRPSQRDPLLANGVTHLWQSVAGDWQAWGSCQPAAGANCSFSAVNGLAAGADLHGINLAGATITNSDLSHANLNNADLRQVTSAAPLTGANLSGDRASGASLTGDLTGADLTNADLSGANTGPSVFLTKHGGADLYRLTVTLPQADKTLEGHSFGNDNLAAVSFFGPSNGLASLRDADFSAATLGPTSFFNVDLTGAKFHVPATISPYGWVSFYKTVICPDGAPPDPTLGDFAACRLKK